MPILEGFLTPLLLLGNCRTVLHRLTLAQLGSQINVTETRCVYYQAANTNSLGRIWGRGWLGCYYPTECPAVAISALPCLILSKCVLMLLPHQDLTANPLVLSTWFLHPSSPHGPSLRALPLWFLWYALKNQKFQPILFRPASGWSALLLTNWGWHKTIFT